MYVFMRAYVQACKCVGVFVWCMSYSLKLLMLRHLILTCSTCCSSRLVYIIFKLLVACSIYSLVCLLFSVDLMVQL